MSYRYFTFKTYFPMDFLERFSGSLYIIRTMTFESYPLGSQVAGVKVIIRPPAAGSVEVSEGQ